MSLSLYPLTLFLNMSPTYPVKRSAPQTQHVRKETLSPSFLPTPAPVPPQHPLPPRRTSDYWSSYFLSIYFIWDFSQSHLLMSPWVTHVLLCLSEFWNMVSKICKTYHSYSSFSTHFGNHPFCKALPESFRFSWLSVWVCHITLEPPIITFSSRPYIAFLLVCLLHQIVSLWRAGVLSLYSSFYPQNLAQVPGHSRRSVNMYWMND